MMSRTSCFAVVVLACVAASASACTVRNLDASGRGSLRDCIEQASAAPGGGEFFIIFRPSLGGSTIPLTDGSQECSSLSLKNPDSGRLLKTVTIRGPRRGEIIVDATGCPDTTVFDAGLDVSINMENVVVEGGFDGILLFGTDFDASIAESLKVNNCGFIGQTRHGIYAFDTTVIHISRTTIEGCGDDGIRIVESVGLPPPGIFDYSFTDVVAVANGQINLNGDGAEIVAGNGVLSVQDCTFDSNADDGLQIRPSVVAPSAGLVTSVSDSHFDSNGFVGENSGANGMKVESTFVGRISGSSFDGNSNYGFVIDNGKVESISRSEFNDNGDAGLELEDATLASIRRSTFNGNANWGIELETRDPNATIATTITSIKLSTLDGNGEGAIECKNKSPREQGPAQRSTETARSVSGKTEKLAVLGED